MHPLDNAAWRAFTGPQAGLSERLGGAARHRPDVSPFCALPDEPTAEDWRDLAALVGDQPAYPFRARLDVPADWRVEWALRCFQLVAPPSLRSSALPVRDVEVLGPDDRDDVLALVELTKPGPFLARTMELGTYLGVRVAGRLVAMAGERMRLDGHTEISAVATHPRHRGEGLASALVGELVAQSRGRGDAAFLHVADDNAAALRVYEHLGFTVRADVVVQELHAPA